MLEKSENFDTMGRIRRRYQVFMEILGFSQIEEARSLRSGEVRRRYWVFLKGFSMKFRNCCEKNVETFFSLFFQLIEFLKNLKISDWGQK